MTHHTMPAMTGAALAQELWRRRPELPGILCSGFNHTMHAAKAQALGLDAFLFKPLLHRDLGLAVRRVLEEHRAQSFQALQPVVSLAQSWARLFPLWNKNCISTNVGMQ